MAAHGACLQRGSGCEDPVVVEEKRGGGRTLLSPKLKTFQLLGAQNGRRKFASFSVFSKLASQISERLHLPSPPPHVKTRRGLHKTREQQPLTCPPQSTLWRCRWPLATHLYHLAANTLRARSYLNTTLYMLPPSCDASQRFLMTATLRTSQENGAWKLVCMARPMPSSTTRSASICFIRSLRS